MRSKIGTNSRLAAHILAMVLLILMLVYLTAPAKAPVDPVPLPIPQRVTPTDTAGAEPAPPTSAPPQKPSTPEAETAVPETALTAPSPSPNADAAKPETTSEEPGTPEQPDAAIASANDAAPPAGQPDESGSLVVSRSETGAMGPVEVAEPLNNANLEVLGDGVYWLSPRHDVAKELAAIPEIETLVLLAPDSDYRPQGFEHINTEIVSANPADLSGDAAARFIHLTSARSTPVVVADLPGARASAFFKGAYFLAHRKAGIEEILVDIAPELREAGTDAEEIIHRLRGLDAAGTKKQ